MNRRGFIKFEEIPLKGRHLKELPKDQAAMLALLSCAYNEVNVLLRLYTLNAYDVDDPKPAHLVSMATKMFLARTLSAKLFEVVELLNGKQAWNKTSDPTIVAFKETALSKFLNISGGEGFRVAKSLRHECTNHYSLKATKKNLVGLDDDADLTFYIHKTEGNSFALAGERVVFQQRFLDGRFGHSSDEAELNYFELWLDWSLQALRWLKETCADYIFRVLPKHVSQNIKWNQVYWPDLEILGELGKSKAPVFMTEAR